LGRNPERVEELARAVGGEGRRMSDLRATLPEVDVVVSSTSAPDFVVDYDVVQGSRRSRRGREQFYVDLAVPRDIDPRANSIDGVFVYNIDDLSQVVAQTLSLRSREAEAAERIVAEETRGFERWSDAEQATPAIVRLRARLRRVLGAELARTLRGKLKHLSAEDRAALGKMLEAAENRLLHAPTMRLRRAASERDAEPGLELLVTALNELFGVDDDDELAYDDDVAEPQPVSLPRSSTGTR
jgi:glutamyl-tRNA reductase